MAGMGAGGRGDWTPALNVSPPAKLPDPWPPAQVLCGTWRLGLGGRLGTPTGNFWVEQRGKVLRITGSGSSLPA